MAIFSSSLIRTTTVELRFPAGRERRRINFPARAAIDSVWSTTPAAMALAGMPGNLAVVGSCTRVVPPAALIALIPLVPSEAVPDRITPTAWLPRSAASAVKKSSTGR